MPGLGKGAGNEWKIFPGDATQWRWRRRRRLQQKCAKFNMPFDVAEGEGSEEKVGERDAEGVEGGSSWYCVWRLP